MAGYRSGGLKGVDFLHHAFQHTRVLKHNHTTSANTEPITGNFFKKLFPSYFSKVTKIFRGVHLNVMRPWAPTWFESEARPCSSDSEEAAFETCVRKPAWVDAFWNTDLSVPLSQHWDNAVVTCEVDLNGLTFCMTPFNTPGFWNTSCKYFIKCMHWYKSRIQIQVGFKTDSDLFSETFGQSLLTQLDYGQSRDYVHAPERLVCETICVSKHYDYDYYVLQINKIRQ